MIEVTEQPSDTTTGVTSLSVDPGTVRDRGDRAALRHYHSGGGGGGRGGREGGSYIIMSKVSSKAYATQHTAHHVTQV